MSTQLAYRPDIDGLRAVAVVPVVGFHAGTVFPGGYVGVDIFFVISGFLITSLILKGLRVEQFSIIEFWERRARRIVPAMAVMVATTVAAGWFILLPEDFKELGQSMVAQSAMLSNVYFWREAGYFAGPSELKCLLHTWSLSIEEQFYLIIAPLSCVLFRVLGRFTSAAIGLLMLGSFLWSLGRVSGAPDAAFFLLPSRAWELLLGAFMALHRDRASMPRWLAEALSWLGGIAIALAVFGYDRSTAFPGAAALLPCGGAAAIIWSNTTGSTSLGRLLSLRPVVFIGLISYSLYLWHWPLICLRKLFEPVGIICMGADSTCSGKYARCSYFMAVGGDSLSNT